MSPHPVQTGAVPFLDLGRAHDPLLPEETAAVKRILSSHRYVLGEEVAAFERELAAFHECSEAVGCASGSDALLLALMALDVGPGDEVVTTPFTFFATVSSIVRLGARPVLVDIDPATFCMDPAAAAAAFTGNTRAVVPVHLYGQSADLRPLLPAASRRDVTIIEDAAQALGARYGDRRVGTVGAMGCHSFYPTKNLGGLGDGGALILSSPERAGRLRLLRNHGDRGRYQHVELGINSRLDALQAAALRVRLPRVDRWVEERRALAGHYHERLAALQQAGRVRLPEEAPHGRHSYNLYTVRVQGREKVIESLTRDGIGCAVHYPMPLHLQPCFRSLGHQQGEFPEAEQAAREVLSLPLFPGLGADEQDRVVESLTRSLGD